MGDKSMDVCASSDGKDASDFSAAAAALQKREADEGDNEEQEQEQEQIPEEKALPLTLSRQMCLSFAKVRKGIRCWVF